MHQKKAVTKELAKRYKRASKRQKSLILDEYTAITSYNRSYAAWALRRAATGLPAKKKPRRPRATEVHLTSG